MLSRLIIKLGAQEINARGRSGKPRPPAPGPTLQAHWHPRPSAADPAKCIRAEVYTGLGYDPAPLPGRTALIFDDGEWHEELTLDWLRKSAYQVHSTQMPLDCGRLDWIDPDLWRWCDHCDAWVRADRLHGHDDAIVTDPLNVDRMLEHKAINFFTWQRFENGELPLGYLSQTGHYICGARKDNPDLNQGILIIKNKATAQYLDMVVEVRGEDLHLLELETSKDDVKVDLAKDVTPMWRFPDGSRVWPNFRQEIMDRFRLIQDYIDRKTLPRRQYSKPDGDWQCDYCRFGETCWEGYEQAALAAGAVQVEGLADLLREKDRLAPSVKRHKDAWDEAKKLVTLAETFHAYDQDWEMTGNQTKAGLRWKVRQLVEREREAA